MPRPVDSSDLDRLGDDLRQEMAAMRSELREELREGDAATRRHIDVLHAQLLERMDATAAETRRHFDVVAEHLNSNFKASAEGLGALDEKVDRFRGEVTGEFATVDRRLLYLQVRVIGTSDPS